MTPRDNFSGRSLTRFGVGEVIDLSVIITPVNPLRWRIAAGGGRVVNGTKGTGTYIAPGMASRVTLELVETTTTSGATTTRIVSTHSFNVVEPSDALMKRRPGTGIRHTHTFWDVGFLGEIFLHPVDVSFEFIEFREGSVAAVTTGFLTPLSATHPLGIWVSVGGGNSSDGSKVNGIDTIYSGKLSPPFGNGTFLWAIPWQYRAGSGAARTFTTANHFAMALHVPLVGILGSATITKKGAGPFTRVATDPTTSS
jgi:hypothetical protein